MDIELIHAETGAVYLFKDISENEYAKLQIDGSHVEHLIQTAIQCGVQPIRFAYNVEQPSPQTSASSNNQPSLVSKEQNGTTHLEKNVWVSSAVLLLIDEYRKLKDKFDGPYLKKKLWQEIATVLIENGHNVTGEMCDRKFRGLNDTFKKIFDKNGKTGRGKNVWEFYNIMLELNEKNPALTPTALGAIGVANIFKTSEPNTRPSSSSSNISWPPSTGSSSSNNVDIADEIDSFPKQPPTKSRKADKKVEALNTFSTVMANYTRCYEERTNVLSEFLKNVKRNNQSSDESGDEAQQQNKSKRKKNP